MTDLVQTLLSDPRVLAGLGIAITLLIQKARRLTYREHVTYQTIANRVFPIIDPYARRVGRPLTRARYGPSEDPDAHKTGVDLSPREFGRRLRKRGFIPSVLSSAKWRESEGGGRSYVHTQYIKFHDSPDGKMQTHVYLWATDDGLDVYAHYEPAVTRPGAHNKGEQTAGDARDTLYGIPGNNGSGWLRRP